MRDNSIRRSSWWWNLKACASQLLDVCGEELCTGDNVQERHFLEMSDFTNKNVEDHIIFEFQVTF
jgi:hypothetical protein